MSLLIKLINQINDETGGFRFPDFVDLTTVCRLI